MPRTDLRNISYSLQSQETRNPPFIMDQKDIKGKWLKTGARF
jgi:hypothetical protein